MPPLRRTLAALTVISIAVFAACAFAWIQGYRQLGSDSFFEWAAGRFVGFGSGYSWREAYFSLGQFSDHGMPMNLKLLRSIDVPRLPDWEYRLPILGPLLLSLIAPAAWMILSFRSKRCRGFPIEPKTPNAITP